MHPCRSAHALRGVLVIASACTLALSGCGGGGSSGSTSGAATAAAGHVCGLRLIYQGGAYDDFPNRFMLLTSDQYTAAQGAPFVQNVHAGASRPTYLPGADKTARAGVAVRDEDIRRIYENMVKDGVTTKPLNDIYPQIKWQAEKQLEVQLLNGWIGSLRKDAAVKINDDVLKSLK